MHLPHSTQEANGATELNEPPLNQAARTGPPIVMGDAAAVVRARTGPPIVMGDAAAVVGGKREPLGHPDGGWPRFPIKLTCPAGDAHTLTRLVVSAENQVSRPGQVQRLIRRDHLTPPGPASASR